MVQLQDLTFAFLDLSAVSVFRLQELEDQYRKEREEANNLLEQQRLVHNINIIKKHLK